MAGHVITVIAGSGIGERLKGRTQEIQTKYGTVAPMVDRIGGNTVYFIARHGYNHSVPPHKVNYKAHIELARQVGSDAILATNAVGIVDHLRYRPRDIILPHGSIALFLTLDGGGPVTFYDSFEDGGPKHADASEPFSARLRCLLRVVATLNTVETVDGAVMMTLPGPAYETPHEVQLLRQWGVDIVGMTSGYEVKLAGEAGIPYGGIAIGTNMGAGITHGRLSHPEVQAVMAEKAPEVFKILSAGIEAL